MAISDFGESLLSKQRERQKKEQRKADRQALLGTAATVGIGLYRNNLKKKQEEFLNSQPVMDMRIQYRQSQRIADDAFKERDRITAAGGNYDQYYYDQAFKELREERIASDDNEDRKDYYKDGRYDHLIAEKAREIAKQRAAAQREREAFGNKFKAQGTFEDVLKLHGKRPNSVFEGVVNMFRGKSNAELDREALEAMRRSSLGVLALPANASQKSQAEELEEAFRLTGDYVEAAKVMKHPEFKRDINQKITYSGKFESTTGKYQYVKQVAQYDDVTGEQIGVTLETADTVDLNDSSAVNKAAVKQALSSFDPRRSITSHLNEAGQREFKQRFEAEVGTKIETMEQYNTAMRIFSEIGSDKDVDYVTSPRNKFTAIQQAALQSDDIKNELAIISAQLQSTDPNEVDKGRKAYEVLMRRIAELGDLG